MSKKGYYSGTKGQFVKDRMNEGKTNREARNDWSKSKEREQFDENYWGRSPGPVSSDPIDRSHESPMQDWAETEDDF